MYFEKDIDAWISSSLEDCECPVCRNSLKLGWQICSCGQILNVERITLQNSESLYYVTRERDEVQELLDEIEGRSQLSSRYALV